MEQITWLGDAAWILVGSAVAIGGIYVWAMVDLVRGRRK